MPTSSSYDGGEGTSGNVGDGVVVLKQSRRVVEIFLRAKVNANEKFNGMCS